MKTLMLSAAFLAVVLLCGCSVVAVGPVPGAITIDQKGPVAVGPSGSASKVGVSQAQGILLVSFGDASIETAMRNAGISRIHHVDNETLNILGIYARYETHVYGD